MAANWLGIVLLGLLWWALGQHWLTMLVLTFAAIIYTMGRAGRHLPARRKRLEQIYATCRKDFGWPTVLPTRPANPDAYITVRRWHRSPGIPLAGAIRYEPDARAAQLAAHARVEGLVEQSLSVPDGQAVVFEHNQPTALTFTVIDADDPAVARRKTRLWIEQTAARILGGKNSDDLSVQIDWDDSASRPDVPARIEIDFGSSVNPDTRLRTSVETDFDANVDRGVEWLYDWQPGGIVEITGVDPDSDDATQKRTLGQVTNMVKSSLPAPVARTVAVSVDSWDQSNAPTAITCLFHDADMTSPITARNTVRGLARTLVSRWSDRVWLPQWSFTTAPQLVLTSAAIGTVEAIRQIRFEQFTAIMDNIMRVNKNAQAPDMTVESWRDVTTDSGQVAESHPAQITITLGDADTAETKQIAIEEAFDSISSKTGFGYDWNTDDRKLVMVEYPALPKYDFFPDPTNRDEFPEFSRQAELAKKGKIVLGPAKGGTFGMIDFDSVPHYLFGGNTGTGKALADSTPIATPSGWTTMGALQVGDEVFDDTGAPCKVTGVFPQPDGSPCNEVEFSDGSVIVADDAHLWWTEDRAARVAQYQQRHWEPTRKRRKRLDATTVGVLRELAETATTEDTITLPEIGIILNGTPNPPRWARDVAESIGPVREQLVEQHAFTYRGVPFQQRQKVRLYRAGDSLPLLAKKAATAPKGTLLASSAVGLSTLAATTDDDTIITAADVAHALAIPRRVAKNWLYPMSAVGTEKRWVTVTPPNKTVMRRHAPVRLFPAAAVYAALADHGDAYLWDQRDHIALGKPRTTSAIRETLRTPSGHLNHTVPVAGPLQCPQRPLPVPPYTLGAWLGDGHSYNGQLASADPQILDRITAEGFTVTPGPASDTTPCRSYTIRGLHAALRNAGIFPAGERGERGIKHIPAVYQRASIEQRRTLLAGLLDTDGTVSPRGTVHFDNTDERLARDVLALARGLGYRATIITKNATLNGRTVGATYRVAFTTGDTVFGLDRKNTTHRERSVCHNPERVRNRYITDVRPCASVPTRCITVDSPRRLFLAGDALIPTHNSVALTVPLFWALWWPDYYDLLVCDPKMTDFTWTAEFPNVTFAAEPQEIADVVAHALSEMKRKQKLLRKHGVEKVALLRALAAQGKIDPAEVPRRTLLFFDEIAVYLNPSKDEEVQVLQGEARSNLEQIMMLGRASETNVIGAAQKPSNENIGTQIRELMGGKVGVGYMKDNMSVQVLGDGRAARLPRKNTPKGRAWVLVEGKEDALTQTYYLPKRDETIEWADGQPLRPGVLDMIRKRLAATGWQQITITNDAGGQEFRWVHPSQVEQAPA